MGRVKLAADLTDLVDSLERDGVEFHESRSGHTRSLVGSKAGADICCFTTNDGDSGVLFRVHDRNVGRVQAPRHEGGVAEFIDVDAWVAAIEGTMLPLTPPVLATQVSQARRVLGWFERTEQLDSVSQAAAALVRWRNAMLFPEILPPGDLPAIIRQLELTGRVEEAGALSMP